MKRILLIILIFILWLCTFNGCSTVYLKQSFSDLSKSTKSIGKNTTYCFEQLFNEEINTRIAESVKKETFKPSDLEPHVLTWEQLELREELLNYLVNYVNLLESIIIQDYQKDISKNANGVKTNLKNISALHPDLVDKKVTGLLSSIYAALAEAFTASARRGFLVKIMKQHQPILEVVIQKLKQELKTSQGMINNFFDRQFLLQVTLPWPDKETKREKYAKIGAKILKRKREINSMLKQVIRALEMIPTAHQRLLDYVEYKKGTLNALVQLTDYGARIEEMYRKYAK